MKIKLLYLLFVLPIICVGQGDLVRWSNTNFTPTIVASNISASNITLSSSGTSFGAQDNWCGHRMERNSNTNNYSNTAYHQFAISSNTGFNINLSQFIFRYYRGNSTEWASNIRVRYSKTADFSSGVAQFTDITSIAQNSTNTATLNFPANTVVNSGETMYIRIHIWGSSNANWTAVCLRNSGSSDNTTVPTIRGTVIAVSAAPVAQNDNTSAFYNDPTNIDILGNDTSNGTITAINITQQPTNGQNIAVNGVTNVTYTSNNNYVGSDSFKYTLTNANGTSNEATVTINVTAPIAPTAVSDQSSTQENEPVIINVLANDTSGSSSFNTLNIITSPTSGSVFVNPDKTITYTPNNSFIGQDSFQYNVSNNQGLVSNTVTVNVTVASVLASWALTSNANATFMQSYVVAEQLTTANSCNSAQGAKIYGFNHGNSFVHYRYFEIRIKPTSGNIISLSNLLFEQQAVGSSPTNYTLRYYIAENHNIPATDALFNASTVLVSDESINGNQVKNVSLGSLIINSNQTLVIRFYPKGTQWGDCNNNYWLIKANTLKLQGKRLLPLSGTYVIGDGANADFSTLTSAVNALNSVGVAAPVTFLLDKAMFENTTNYSNGERFPLTINSFAGSSSTNTVTFKPAPSRNLVTVRVNNLNVGNNDLRPSYLFKLNGADNIIFDGSNNGTDSKNLKIRNNSDYSSDRTIIWLTEGAHNNVFKNMFIEQVENPAWSYAVGIFAGGTSSVGSESNNPASNITVHDNHFMGVKQGVYLANNDSNFSTNYTIYNNDFGDPNQQNMLVNSVYLKGIQNFNVYNNSIYDIYVTWTGSGYHSGIYILGNSINGKIYKNRIRSIFGNANNTLTSGIRLATTNSSNDSGISITNNFISNIRSAGGGSVGQGAYGIYAEQGKGYKIYHNSVNNTLNNPSGISASLLVNQATGLDVRNNIFINRATQAGSYKFAIAINNSPSLSTVFTHLDYNNYSIHQAQAQSFVAGYGNLTNLNTNNPSFHKTLANWQTVTPSSMDVNSGSSMTVFISDNNLHINDNASWVNNTGFGLTAEFGALGLTYDDIDDQPRSGSTPDIGADEFGIPIPEPGICEVTYYWNGTSWVDENDNIVTPNRNYKTQLNAAYNTELHGSFATCELTVATGGSLRVDGGDYVYIVNSLINTLTASAVVVENNGNIVQETDFNGNSGDITYKRVTNPMYNYDYTYWSSPVAGQTTQSLSPNSGNFRYRFNSDVIASGANYIQQGWVAHQGVMQPGQGYIIKGPNNFPNNPAGTPQRFTANFKGIPNSGPVSVTVDFGSNNPSLLPVASQANPATGYPDGDYGWYFFGNPYPSAIDASKFRNFSGNDDVLGTSIYLWAHNTQPVLPENAELYQYVANDFAVFNTAFMDGTQASPFQPEEPVVGGSTSQNPNYNAAGRYIASGQGFFMPAKAGSVFFNNSMRVNPAYPNGNIPNNHFYRIASGVDASSIDPVSEGNNSESPDPNIHKMKLSLQNASGAFHQIMVGYINGATNGLDHTDAVVFGGASYVTLYSITEEAALVVQGRALPFSTEDEVQLGIRLGNISGTFSINLDHVDGLFKEEYGNQDIYLYDSYTDVYHDLKSGAYEFTSEEGIYNNRFVLRYFNPLSINNPVLDNNWGVYTKDDKIEIFSNGFSMKDIAIYDITGRLIYQKQEVMSTQHSLDSVSANQILIVKITSEDNRVSTKKIKN